MRRHALPARHHIRLWGPVTANGGYSDRLVAASGNEDLALRADSSFDGGSDDVVCYLETEACLDQGTHYVWLEPVSEDNLSGPVSARSRY